MGRKKRRWRKWRKRQEQKGMINTNLGRLVEAGRFREDLYYRLSGFVIAIPPLRERKEDIPLLARHFLEENQQMYDGAPASFSAGALDALLEYPWPGNVRELRTVIDRAVAFAEGNAIRSKDIQFSHPFSGLSAPAGSDGTTSLLDTPFYAAVEAFEHRYLSDLLAKVGGNISKASQVSGASRKTIREKGKKYGLL